MSLMARLQNPPSFIETEKFKFLIMDAPTDHNLDVYIEWLKKYNIETLVRTCEPTYATIGLEKEGIKVIPVCFSDDASPSRQVIEEWLNIVKNENVNNDRPVGIHCVAGLGRSALLVAIALIYFAKMNALDSVEFIRNKRRGALNQAQLNYLKNFKFHHGDACCSML